MGGIQEQFWYYYTPALVLALGIVMIVWGLYSGVKRLRQESKDPGRALAIAQTMRIVFIGLSITGMGIIFLFDLKTLVILSLIFGVGEFLETSVIIGALKSSLRYSQ
ncbi:MAG: hypothetical protein ACREOW_12380 [Thermodesulfobacteriota bacterium]